MSTTTIIRPIRNIMRKDEGVDGDGDAQRISQMLWMLLYFNFFDKELHLAKLVVNSR